MNNAQVALPTNDETSVELDEVAVDNARIELIYQTFPTHMFTATAVSLLILYVMWSGDNKQQLLIWFLCVNVAGVLRIWSWKRFNRKLSTTSGPLKPWAWFAMLHIAVSGHMWGLVPVIFVEIGTDSMSKVIVAYFFSTFIMIGQSVTYCSYRPMWFAYAIPASSLMIGQLIIDPFPNSNMWALALLLVMAFCLLSLQKNSREIIEAITLKLKYGELMHRLQEEKDKADQANKSKSVFLASASHDLRQPVHAMNLFIEMLQKKSMPDNTRQLVDRIATCARSLQSLFNSLLDISNLDAGTINYQPKPVRAANYINALVALHKPEAEEKNLQLEADADDIVLYTDPVLLTRILSNLMANAINHSGTGVIRLRAKQEGAQARLSVEDTGKGIAVEEQEHIFDEFRQLHNPERDRTKGLGLGLSICARLAKLMGTEIRLESEASRGSCFFFSLPIAEQHQLTESIDEPDYSDLDFAEINVLILDDEESIREAMGMLMLDWGCKTVHTAGDLEEALTLINEGDKPDIIISDYRLRNHQTGVHAVEAIRSEFDNDIAAILVTGDTSLKSLADIQASKITSLHKPVDTHQLQTMISVLLS